MVALNPTQERAIRDAREREQRRANRPTIRLPELHPGQQAVWRVITKNLARFAVLVCGRRWGKTRFAALLCIYVALRGGRAWWIAPTVKYARPGWREIRGLAKQIPGAEIRESERSVSFPNGGSITAYSAHDPDSLRGEGLDLAVLEECAYLPSDRVWTEVVRPMLADRQGQAVFIGTPRGRNWFWRLYQRGQDPKEKDWYSIQIPTSSNPHIKPEEIASARKDLPDLVFLQEFLAQFLDDTNGYFRKILEAATADPQRERLPNHEYVFGIDWGRTHDYTSVTIFDVTLRAVVAVERWNYTEFGVQEDRIIDCYNRFLPTIMVCESNSFGKPIIERFQSMGYPAVEFWTSNASKRIACESFNLALQAGQATIIDDPVLIGELQAFEATQLPGGLWKFGAPEGMYDDTVMSTVLGWQGVVTPMDDTVFDDTRVAISPY